MLHFHTLKVAEVRPETFDSVSVVFDVPDELRDAYRFIHGQHLTLKADLEGEDLRRSYSICSGVDDGVLRVGVRKIKGGRFSTWINEQLKPGQSLEVLTPTGGFHTELDADNEKNYLAIAGGAGITPVFSIIKTTLMTEPKSRFILLFGNRTTSSIMFREDLEDLKNQYMDRFAIHHFLDQEEQDIDIYNGPIDPDRLGRLTGELFNPKAVDEFFICGPNTMIEDLAEELKDKGVDSDHIHFEHFNTDTTEEPVAAPAMTREEAPQTQCRVTVILDGVQTEFSLDGSGESLLDAALNSGNELPFSCKGGVCGTCRALLKEGQVEMASNFALEDYEIEEGFILACQSHPLTDKIVLDFDEA